LQGGGDSLGEQRRLHRQGIAVRLHVWAPPAAEQEPLDPALQAREKRHDVGVGGRRQAVEHWPCGRGRARVHAVEEQCVEMEVEIRSAATPLDGRDAAAARPDQAPAGGTAPLPAEDGAQEDPQHRAREPRVERELRAHRHRHREHPLADGHGWEDVVDQVRGQLTHPPAATRRTDPAPFARKGDDDGVPAALALGAHEAVLEPATAEVRLELAADERRPPPGPVLPDRAGQERRQVRGDGPVEDGLLGLGAPVGWSRGTPPSHVGRPEHAPCLGAAGVRRVVPPRSCGSGWRSSGEPFRLRIDTR
jgi:hypothetical protein